MVKEIEIILPLNDYIAQSLSYIPKDTICEKSKKYPNNSHMSGQFVPVLEVKRSKKNVVF